MIVVIRIFSLAVISCLFTIISYGQAPNSSFQCGDYLTDPRDGQTYRTVQIGTQCWRAENLNTGVRISVVKDQRDNGIIEKYCYDNQDESCKIYGGLYQWDEAVQYLYGQGTKGICPPVEGWHVPSDKDWCTLAMFLDTTVNCAAWGPTGTEAGTKLKSTGTVDKKTGLWLDTDKDASNKSGFSAIPAGTRSIYAKYYYLGYHAYFWTSSDSNTLNAWFYYLKYSNKSIYRESYFKASGYSVRCVRND